MPVISFVSSKGGAGKTTAAVILATVLADALNEGEAGSVALLDADPNQPIVRWGAQAGLPTTLAVLGGINEDNILETIEQEARQRKFVIVDTEGSANLALNYAMSQSHLVVIPVQASHLDADEAARTIKLVDRLRRTTRAAIDCVVVWQRANAAIETGTAKAIRLQFQEARIPVLTTKLIEREAFKAIFSFGRTLSTLTDQQVRTLEKARDNGAAFAEEVVARIKGQRQHDRAA